MTSMIYFGDVDLTADDRWEAETEFKQRSLRLDLNVQSDEVDAKTLDNVDRLLSDLSALDRTARAALCADFERGEVSSSELYRSHHLAELAEEERVQCFGVGDPRAVDVDLFLSRLHLSRIGLYPEVSDACVVLDYTLGVDVTNYVLTVSLDASGLATDVAMES